METLLDRLAIPLGIIMMVVVLTPVAIIAVGFLTK